MRIVSLHYTIVANCNLQIVKHTQSLRHRPRVARQSEQSESKDSKSQSILQVLVSSATSHAVRIPRVQCAQSPALLLSALIANFHFFQFDLRHLHTHTQTLLPLIYINFQLVCCRCTIHRQHSTRLPLPRFGLSYSSFNLGAQSNQRSS